MARDATFQSHNSQIDQAHSRRTFTALRQHSVIISQSELGISFVYPARLNTAAQGALSIGYGRAWFPSAERRHRILRPSVSCRSVCLTDNVTRHPQRDNLSATLRTSRRL